MGTQYLGGRRRESAPKGSRMSNSLFPIKTHEAEGGGKCSLEKLLKLLKNEKGEAARKYAEQRSRQRLQEIGRELQSMEPERNTKGLERVRHCKKSCQGGIGMHACGPWDRGG